MSNLVSLLGNAANGLQVFQAATATASHNMQNANTAGYARQRVDITTQEPEAAQGSWIGRGVLLGGVSQSRDAFLERQIPAALGSAAQFAAESGALLSLGALSPDQVGSLTDAFGKFYSDLRAMSQNPGDPALRTALVGTARNLALSFNRTSTAIEETRSGLDYKIASDVQEINDVAREIADINKRITAARSQGSQPNDLLDQRLRARDRLAQLTGAVAVPDDRGNFNMVLQGGMALVTAGEAATLSTAADVANGGHLTVLVTRIGASVPDSFSSATAFGGELRGILDARDVGLQQALTQLDTMAFDFATTFNTQHRLGFALDGTAGGDFFSVSATAPTAARAIGVAAAITADPGKIAAAAAAITAPGDSTNLLSLIGTEQSVLSGGKDVAGTLSSIISTFGARARSSQAMADQDAAVAAHLDNLRESTSGVSLDEEMVAMTQAQRSFEAVAKIIKVTDDLLRVLMDMK